MKQFEFFLINTLINQLNNLYVSMIITHINDIPINEYPVFQSMLNSTLVRFSKWECTKYWERQGRNYSEIMEIYDKHIKAVDEIIYAGARS